MGFLSKRGKIPDHFPQKNTKKIVNKYTLVIKKPRSQEGVFFFFNFMK